MDDVALHNGGKVLETSSTELVKAVEVLKNVDAHFEKPIAGRSPTIWAKKS